MPGYLGYLRGSSQNALAGSLEFIWQGCRARHQPIAKIRRTEYLERKEARELNAAQGMVTV
jgi:hypothetical protein